MPLSSQTTLALSKMTIPRRCKSKKCTSQAHTILVIRKSLSRSRRPSRKLHSPTKQVPKPNRLMLRIVMVKKYAFSLKSSTFSKKRMLVNSTRISRRISSKTIFHI